jgi:subtilisin-like proprotein convertase family protein
VRRLLWILVCGCVSIHACTVSAEPIRFTGDFSQPIPAVGDQGWMEPVTFEIDRHLWIKDLDVALTIAHGEVSDLGIFMDSPWGATVVLKEGGGLLWQTRQSDMKGTIFDDEAPTGMEAGTSPFEGAYHLPTGQSLSVFDGYDAFGVWTLRIEDIYKADAGTLQQWSLIIEPTHTPEPGGIALIAAGVMFLRRRRFK